jgi:hypothetical protein
MLTIIATMTMAMIDYLFLLHHGGGGEEEEDQPSLNSTSKLSRSASWWGDLRAATARCLRDCQGLLLPPLPPRVAGGGRRLAACAATGCWDGRRWQWQLQLFEQKRGWTSGGRGIERWVCFFMLSYFVIVFLVYPFQCRLTDFVSRSSQLLDGLPLQDFSSSHPNLVITFLFGSYSVRINCGK